MRSRPHLPVLLAALAGSLLGFASASAEPVELVYGIAPQVTSSKSEIPGVAGAHVIEAGAAFTAANDLGHLTSACHSPTLGHDIALGFVLDGRARLGATVRAVCRLRGLDITAEGLAVVRGKQRDRDPACLRREIAALEQPAAAPWWQRLSRRVRRLLPPWGRR